MKLGLATQTGAPPAYITGINPMPFMPGSGPAMMSPLSSVSYLPPASVQPPTPFLLIANMFDPREETEPDWDVDIAEEMKEEGGKHGPLLHVHVDRASMGHVYLHFAAVDGAQAACTAFHGRWFGGRQLQASYLPEAAYLQKFPQDAPRS